MNEVYVDGVGQLHYLSNMIRMDLITIAPDDTGEVRHEVKQRIIMTPQAFANTMDTMQKLADKLVESGVFAKTSDNANAEYLKPTEGEMAESVKKTRRSKKS